MAVALLDTSAVVGYLDPDDDLHVSAVDAIEPALAAGTFLTLSAVTWAELLHGALLDYYSEYALREFVYDLAVDILMVDVAIAERAAELQREYRGTSMTEPRPRLRTPDALILATVDVHGVELVVSGDRKWANVPGVQAEFTMLAKST